MPLLGLLFVGLGSVRPCRARVGAAVIRLGLFKFTIPLETKSRGKKKRKKMVMEGSMVGLERVLVSL